MAKDSPQLAGTMKVKKFILCFVNFLCIVIGLALVIMGIVIQTGKSISFLKDFSSGFGSMGVYAVVAGLIVFFIAFVGCIGAWKESWCILFLYAFIILAILILVVVFVIIVVVKKPMWETEAQNAMFKLLNDYNAGNTTLKMKDIWTPMQTELNCCGVVDYTDWRNATAFQKKHKDAVPNSCCLKDVRAKGNSTDCGEGMLDLEKTETTRSTINGTKPLNQTTTVAPVAPTIDMASKTINTEGCYTVLRGWISDHSTKITIAFAIFIVVMLIVVVMSCCLAGGIRSRNKYTGI